jgi:hypothetical protein
MKISFSNTCTPLGTKEAPQYSARHVLRTALPHAFSPNPCRKMAQKLIHSAAVKCQLSAGADRCCARLYQFAPGVLIQFDNNIRTA